MYVQNAPTNGIGTVRLFAAGGRQPGRALCIPDAPAAAGQTRQPEGARKETGREAAAAPSPERRWIARHGERMPLTMSVFNQEDVFEALLVDYGPDGLCVETKRRILPGTSVYMRLDTRQAGAAGKACRQGLRTTALGEVKWCRELNPDRSPAYRVGVRYYTHY
jgi:hypothetical protein